MELCCIVIPFPVCYHEPMGFLCNVEEVIMKRKKQLKELTLKDNFMFGAVMMEEENCRRKCQ